MNLTLDQEGHHAALGFLCEVAPAVHRSFLHKRGGVFLLRQTGTNHVGNKDVG